MLEKCNKLRLWMFSHPLAMALLVFPFFRPKGIAVIYPLFSYFTMVWKALSGVVAFCMFLSKPRLSKLSILLYVYQALLLVCTILGGGSMREWAILTGYVLAVTILLEVCAVTDIRAFIKAVFYVIAVLWLINLATIFIFPNGMYGLTEDVPKREDFFMGLDSDYATYLFPLLATMLIHLTYKKKSTTLKVFLAALFSASIYITWPVSVVVSGTAFLILMLFCRWKKGTVLCNICVYYALIVTVFFALVIFRQQDKFAFLIQNVLHKSMTLSSRTIVWDNVMARLKESPILGFGVWTEPMMMDFFKQNHCHNDFLQVLFNSGAVGMVMYVLMLAMVVKPLMKRRSHYVGYVLSAAIFSLLLAYQVEIPDGYPFFLYIFLLMAYYIEDIIAAYEGPAPEERLEAPAA